MESATLPRVSNLTRPERSHAAQRTQPAPVKLACNREDDGASKKADRSEISAEARQGEANSSSLLENSLQQNYRAVQASKSESPATSPSKAAEQPKAISVPFLEGPKPPARPTGINLDELSKPRLG